MLKYNKYAVPVILLTGSIFVACNSKTNPPATTTATGNKTITADTVANTPAVQNTIAYVDADSLAGKYKYFTDLKNKYEARSKNAQSDLRTKSQAFQREVAQYQQTAATLSADQRKNTEERLARKQQELQSYQQNAGEAIAKDQAKDQVKLYDTVADYLKEYANKHGYKVILQYQKGGGILYIDPSMDITKDVIADLNARYKK